MSDNTAQRWVDFAHGELTVRVIDNGYAPTFTREDVAHTVATVLRELHDHGYDLVHNSGTEHWSLNELADELRGEEAE